MIKDEIFPNPTVKQVIFEIKFPILFSIENKIGDIQELLIEKFPKASLLFQRRVLLADTGPGGELKEIPNEINSSIGQKLWEFKSEKNYKLHISSNRLNIFSEHHKTYNSKKSKDKFRDIIDFVINNFFKVISIPKISRIGLRYIDECPIPQKTNKIFNSYYNSVFPIGRFKISDSNEMFFRTVLKRDKYFLIYIETLKKLKDENKYSLILDFDGFTNDIHSKDFLNVTDKLHEIINKEYFTTIKEPVIRYMRKKRED